MLYNIQESDESIRDVIGLAAYMKRQFNNDKAADNFINSYDRTVSSLCVFPRGFRGTSLEYRGYEIHILPFDTYHIFFVIDDVEQQIIILRVLKDLQNWKIIMDGNNEYHFT